MRKKLLAVVMALALCSTNMPPRLYLRGNLLPGIRKKYPRSLLIPIRSQQKKNYLFLLRRVYLNLVVKQILHQLLLMERNL